MDKNENLISITEVPAGPYIIKGEFKMINKEGKVISATVGYQKEEMDKLMKEIDKALK